jgi:DNA-binding NarL/FixJ family response regulator
MSSESGVFERASMLPVVPSGDQLRLAITHERAHETQAACHYWQEVFSGARFLVNSFSVGQRSYGTFRTRPLHERPLARIGARKLAILERMLMGESQKAIAIDLGVGDSCIAAILADCRRRLGVDGRSCAFPLILVLLSQSGAGSPSPLWQSAGLEPEEILVSLPRPNTAPLSVLTRAEREVLACLIEGRTLQEIARQRKACSRTVANQLATARKKLHVSGRFDLVRLLLSSPVPVVARAHHALSSAICASA